VKVQLVNEATEKILGCKTAACLDKKIFSLSNRKKSSGLQSTKELAKDAVDETDSSNDFETTKKENFVSIKQIFEDPSYLGKSQS
jgi:hypothetical protein